MSNGFASQLSEVLEQLLPNQVFAAMCEVADARITSSAADTGVVSEWATARQQEYLAGRWCARTALKHLGYSGEAALLADADGLPQWPESYLGSISHSKGLCAAVAARHRAVSVLGVDLERIDRLTPAAIRRVVHSREEDFVEGNQLHASILFSLKEAFYKAQYAKWRTPGNFHDLALDVDIEQGTAAVREISPRFSPALVEYSNELHFRFGLFANYVVSLCWLPSGVCKA